MTTAIEWQPVSEYRPECGRVVAWFDSPEPHHGEWYAVNQVILTGGVRIWVNNDYTPIETDGRRVTHFAIPRKP